MAWGCWLLWICSSHVLHCTICHLSCCGSAACGDCPSPTTVANTVSSDSKIAKMVKSTTTSTLVHTSDHIDCAYSCIPHFSLLNKSNLQYVYTWIGTICTGVCVSVSVYMCVTVSSKWITNFHLHVSLFLFSVHWQQFRSLKRSEFKLKLSLQSSSHQFDYALPLFWTGLHPAGQGWDITDRLAEWDASHRYVDCTSARSNCQYDSHKQSLAGSTWPQLCACSNLNIYSFFVPSFMFLTKLNLNEKYCKTDHILHTVV